MNAEYSAMSAKLKAMYSKFLTKADYEALLEKKTVPEICAYLKNTLGYGDVLSGVNEREMHRGQVELLIAGEIQREYIRLYNFSDSSKRDVLKFWFMRREMEMLIKSIKNIFNHEHNRISKDNMDKLEAFFETHTKIDKNLLYEAKSLSDCVEACKDTPYKAVLERVSAINSDLFSVCMALEMFYYSSFWNTINRKLDKVQGDIFKKMLGTKIDALNILWIYRGKKYFGFNDEMIFTYLLPVRYRLSENIIKEMVRSENPQAMVELVRSTKYASLFEGIDSGIFPEENYRRMVRALDKRMFVKYSQSMIAPYAYLDLKETEMNNIVTIIEGVRYGEEPSRIRLHLDI